MLCWAPKRSPTSPEMVASGQHRRQGRMQLGAPWSLSTRPSFFHVFTPEPVKPSRTLPPSLGEAVR